ncbi:MAG TPA: carbamoyltransferase C-terminal domain-containing protein [Smithella sp.]|nr:carbamoyltransferase C-terminal domain-containing protein [Smithella sp.]
MNILGITCFVHDSAACLIKDGKIIANIEEERFNRVKHTGDFPKQSIDYVLHAAGLTIADVDIIAFNWNPVKALIAELLKFVLITPPVYFKMIKHNKPPKHFKTIFYSFFLRRFVKKHMGIGFRGKVVWVDHHMAHAASTYYLSSFDQADILVVDGFGEYESTTFFKAKAHKIERRWWILSLHSLGLIYLNFTRFLGFAPYQEGKTMALSSYGRDTYQNLFNRIFRILPDGTFAIDMRYLSWWNLAGGKFDPDLGLPREPYEPITQRHMDIAASLQKKAIDIVLHMIGAASRASNNKYLCLAGGIFLNCNLNGIAHKSGFYEKYFIPPFTSDTGGAAGAALYAAFGLKNETYTPGTLPFSPYLGPDYPDDEIEKALIKSNLPYRKSESPGIEAARALADNKIIGWMQGRVEAGPRALGARSILANPLHKTIKDRLNQKIKGREYFQPFGPIVTEEAATKYFEIDSPIPQSAYYMLLAVPVKKEYQSQLAGITHVDGTARIQVVRREWCPELYSLLKELEKLTGFAVAINTSFNYHEPIICSPDDAINTFKTRELDMLVLGKFIVEKHTRK